MCLGEMLEFYDSALKLNLSFNQQINVRGWQAIFKAVKNVNIFPSHNFASVTGCLKFCRLAIHLGWKYKYYT